MFDGSERREVWRLVLQSLNERNAGVFVVIIELVGDVLLFVGALVEQRGGAAGEEILGADEQPKPLMRLRVVETAEIPCLIKLAAMAEGVEPDFCAIRYKHPFGAGRVNSILPSLLNWAFVAPRHDSVEVVRFRPLQFEGREDGPFAAGERPKRSIYGAFAQRFFRSN